MTTAPPWSRVHRNVTMQSSQAFVPSITHSSQSIRSTNSSPAMSPLCGGGVTVPGGGSVRGGVGEVDHLVRILAEPSPAPKRKHADGHGEEVADDERDQRAALVVEQQ